MRGTAQPGACISAAEEDARVMWGNEDGGPNPEVGHAVAGLAGLSLHRRTRHRTDRHLRCSKTSSAIAMRGGVNRHSRTAALICLSIVSRHSARALASGWGHVIELHPFTYTGEK